MKNFLFIPTVILLASLFNCGSNESTTNTTDEEDLLVVPDEVVSGLCMWKEVTIRDTPSEKGKFITTVYRGERFTVTGDSAIENVNDKVRQYHRVKLSDGTEGWMRTDFLAIDGVPATFLELTNIFKRPDDVTQTLKTFDVLEFVAIKSMSESGWCEVKGQPFGQEWFSTGWVKCESLSREKNDIRYSLVYTKAMENKDSLKRETELANLIKMEGFKESPFYGQIFDIDSFVVHADDEYSEYDSLN